MAVQRLMTIQISFWFSFIHQEKVQYYDDTHSAGSIRSS